MSARRLFALLLAFYAGGAWGTPSGHAWRVLPTYRLFNHATGINGVSDFSHLLPAVQRSFARWTQPEISCTTWNSTYGGLFNAPGNASAIDAQDGKNSVIWLGGAEWTHDDATLALTSTSYVAATGEIIDADMELNNNHIWKLGGTTLAVDVESIVTHEAGHFLGLDHSPSPSAIMFADYPIGEVKTALTDADKKDVCDVYPSSGTGGLGALCTNNQNCAGPNTCEGKSASGTGICTVSCGGPSSSCPSGYTCQQSGSAFACLRAPGVSDLCHFCTAGSECATGICVTDDARRHNWCTTTCQGSSDCGTGYECVNAGSLSVCAPTGSPTHCPSSQCASASDCAPGYGCVNGMCEASGAVGARCEVTGYCAGCGLCTGSTAEAYCDACCGGAGAGGACSACAMSSCSTGSACTELSTSAGDFVCAPNTGTSCSGCDSGHPCQSGLSCTNGRCRAACSVAHPGSCQACTGLGTCACPDEIAYTGQSCAPAGPVCVSGNVCVGSPSICRALCTEGPVSSCPPGQACEAVGGQSVCTSSAATQGQVCNPVSGGTDCTTGTCTAGLSCYAGRCYEPCDVNNPTCESCLSVGSSKAVCACEDQRVAVGGRCGVVGNSLAICGPGAGCDEGSCHLLCTSGSASACPGSLVCQTKGTSAYCLGASSTAPHRGCGCSQSEGWLGLPALLLAFMKWKRLPRREPTQ